MAHVEKYHIGAIGNLCRHYERAKNNEGNYIKFRNQSIDLTRTASNYNLATFQPLSQKEFIRKRLSEVKVLKRADVKVMCDWVVTLPKGMELDERRFFGETFNFLTNRYGKENVISAYVHRDETQPHIHFAFIPVTMDKKKNIPKVSAKEVLTRVELQKFHGDLDIYLEGVFGKSTGILNDATRDGNKSIDELKRGSAVKKLKELQEERQSEEKRITGLKWSNRIIPIKEKPDTVVISKKDLQSANDALSKEYMLEKQAEDGRKILSKDYRMDNFKLQIDNRRLQKELSSLVAEIAKLKSKFTKYEKAFTAKPALLTSVLQLVAEIERSEELERKAQAEFKYRLAQAEKEEMEL